MIWKLMFGAATVLSLAGCGNPGESGSSTGPAAQPVPAGEMKPGLWSAKVSMATGEQSGETCVTAADLAEAKFLLNDVDDEMCSFAKRRMAGGTIDVDVTCGSDEGATRMTVTGTYGPDEYKAETVMTVGQEPASRIVTEGRWKAAACPGA
jgi:hypothetical protein